MILRTVEIHNFKGISTKICEIDSEMINIYW